jgi:hypothetical protein
MPSVNRSRSSPNIRQLLTRSYSLRNLKQTRTESKGYRIVVALSFDACQNLIQSARWERRPGELDFPLRVPPKEKEPLPALSKTDLHCIYLEHMGAVSANTKFLLEGVPVLYVFSRLCARYVFNNDDFRAHKCCHLRRER